MYYIHLKLRANKCILLGPCTPLQRPLKLSIFCTKSAAETWRQLFAPSKTLGVMFQVRQYCLHLNIYIFIYMHTHPHIVRYSQTLHCRHTHNTLQSPTLSLSSLSLLLHFSLETAGDNLNQLRIKLVSWWIWSCAGHEIHVA